MRGVLEGERSGSASLGMWGRWGICNQGIQQPRRLERSPRHGAGTPRAGVCVWGVGGNAGTALRGRVEAGVF